MSASHLGFMTGFLALQHLSAVILRAIDFFCPASPPLRRPHTALRTSMNRSETTCLVPLQMLCPALETILEKMFVGGLMNLDQCLLQTAPQSTAAALESACPRLESGRLRDNVAD